MSARMDVLFIVSDCDPTITAAYISSLCQEVGGSGGEEHSERVRLVDRSAPTLHRRNKAIVRECGEVAERSKSVGSSPGVVVVDDYGPKQSRQQVIADIKARFPRAILVGCLLVADESANSVGKGIGMAAQLSEGKTPSIDVTPSGQRQKVDPPQLDEGFTIVRRHVASASKLMMSSLKADAQQRPALVVYIPAMPSASNHALYDFVLRSFLSTGASAGGLPFVPLLLPGGMYATDCRDPSDIAAHLQQQFSFPAVSVARAATSGVVLSPTLADLIAALRWSNLDIARSRAIVLRDTSHSPHDAPPLTDWTDLGCHREDLLACLGGREGRQVAERLSELLQVEFPVAQHSTTKSPAILLPRDSVVLCDGAARLAIRAPHTAHKGSVPPGNPVCASLAVLRHTSELFGESVLGKGETYLAHKKLVESTLQLSGVNGNTTMPSYGNLATVTANCVSSDDSNTYKVRADVLLGTAVVASTSCECTSALNYHPGRALCRHAAALVIHQAKRFREAADGDSKPRGTPSTIVKESPARDDSELAVVHSTTVTESAPAVMGPNSRLPAHMHLAPGRGTKKKSETASATVGSRGAGDPRAPKKAVSAYIWFTKTMREEGKVTGPATVAAKQLGAMWKELGDDERARFVAMAEEDKRRYATEMESYRKEAPESPVGATRAPPRGRTKRGRDEVKQEVRSSDTDDEDADEAALAVQGNQEWHRDTNGAWVCAWDSIPDPSMHPIDKKPGAVLARVAGAPNQVGDEGETLDSGTLF